MGNTLSQYAILAAFAGAAILWYKPERLRNLFPQRVAAVQSDVGEKKTSKKNKQRRAATPPPESTDETRRDRKRKITPAPTSAGTIGVEEVALPTTSPPRNDDQGMSDKDFAQLFQQAQAGKRLTPSTKPTAKGKKAKSTPKVEAGHLMSGGFQAESPVISTSASSNAGGDDGFGSPTSEPLSSVTSRAEDTSINDMLEPEAPKPLTLNITNVGRSTNKKPQPISKQPEVILTKKQRAAQRKAAENRALVEESLTAHNAKRESQQRLARMADGTSKQTLANNFNSSQQNAWQAGPEKSSGIINGSGSVNGVAPLLDTREQSTDNTGRIPNGANSPLMTRGSGVSKAGAGSNAKSGLTPSVQKLMNQAKLEKRDWADEVNGETDENETQKREEDETHQHNKGQAIVDDSWSDDIQEQLRQIEAHERKEKEQEQPWQEATSKKNRRKNAKADIDSNSNSDYGTQQNGRANGFSNSPRIGSKSTMS